MNAAVVSAPDRVDSTGPGRPRPREFDWPQITEAAPVLAATMLRYLDQIALSLRPTSVVSAEGILRRFAGYLTSNYPEIEGLVDVERAHIEAFKRYLPTRPGRNGRPPLSEMTIRIALGTLRTFLERVSEWDYPDAPTRVLIFNGDLPTPDDPLPKFLSDVDAAKLMRAAADADPTRRLVIEMLARTGLRVGELCGLTADAVVQINGRPWLRVPVGKLHNDRYLPLTPNSSNSSTNNRLAAATTSTGSSSGTAGRSTDTRSAASSTGSPQPQASATSTPTNSVTPSPPKPSTEA